jgi:hypothetical protein
MWQPLAEYTPKIPNLNSSVFTSGYKPLSLAMKGNRGDVQGVSLERDELKEIRDTGQWEWAERTATGVFDVLAIS